ncbi:hypothetical protein Tco_1547830 [Tanacetum coccineum]
MSQRLVSQSWRISPTSDTTNESISGLYRARNVTIDQTTLGELYQLILNALAKFCNQKKFLAEFERTGKRLGTACDDKYLQIKCKDKSSCDCASFAKKGHFARNCPDKKRSQALIQALNQVEPVDVSDLALLFSLDDEPSDSVLCTIAYSDFSFDDDSDTDSLESDSDFGVHMINPIPHVLPIQEDPSLPLAKVHILTDAYAKPIPVIAFFDTGSSVSILNPNILPDHYWKPHYQNFMAANGENFVIDKINVPINIRLFLKCVIKRRLLGSSSHGKDLLIGFDIRHKLPNLRWSGEASKSLFRLNDKFLLPQKKSLVLNYAVLKVLSKFDLKSGSGVDYNSSLLQGKSPTGIPATYHMWQTPFHILLRITKFTDDIIFTKDDSAVLVKRGIEKFQFHLIGHEFQVEMDMSSFPRMLQFKRKMLPHAQLLRWSNWFSQWKFTVKHIKGTENVLADFLYRPKAYKSEEITKECQASSETHSTPSLMVNQSAGGVNELEPFLQNKKFDGKRETAVDPDKMVYYVMMEHSVGVKTILIIQMDRSKWIVDSYINSVHCEVETFRMIDDVCLGSLWSSDDDVNFVNSKMT